MGKTLLVAGIGELLWDLLPEGKKPGGAPANFAYHAQSLGAESFIVSSVGNGPLGNEIIEFINKKGLNHTYIQRNEDKETGVVNVQLENGIPEYEIKTGVAWDYIAFNNELEKLAGKLDAVCFGALAQRSPVSCSTIQKFLSLTKQGCLRVFDINLRQHFYNKEIISSSLSMANVLKLNDEELPVVAEIFSLKGAEEIVLTQLIEKFDLKLIALTKGSSGSLLITRDSKSELSVPDVEVADTVGAGDSFTAAMIISYLKGKPLGKVHQIANTVAGLVCSMHGAMPVLPGNELNNIFD